MLLSLQQNSNNKNYFLVRRKDVTRIYKQFTLLNNSIVAIIKYFYVLRTNH